MTTSRPLPADLGSAFSCRQARSEGVSKHRLRRPDLDRPFHGARLVPVGPGAEDRDTDAGHSSGREVELRRLEALQSVLPAHAFFTSLTAAWLWEMPLPAGEPHQVHVGVPRECAPVDRPGVTSHRMQPHLISLANGSRLRALDRATTWAALAAEVPLDDLVAAADHLLWVPRDPRREGAAPLGTPLVSGRELADVLERGRWRGGSSAREALGLARDGSMSPPETHLRLLLHRNGLPEPELNANIFDGRGHRFNADAVFRSYRVYLEYQGNHHRSLQQQTADTDRAHTLRETGWEGIEVTASHLYRGPSALVRRVGEALARRGWTP